MRLHFLHALHHLEAGVAGNTLFQKTVSSLYSCMCVYLWVIIRTCVTSCILLWLKNSILLPLLAVCSTNDAHMLWMSLMSHYHEGFQALLLQFKAFRSRFNIVSGCLFIWWQVTHHRLEKALMLVKSANQLMASDSAFRKQVHSQETGAHKLRAWRFSLNR